MRHAEDLSGGLSASLKYTLTKLNYTDYTNENKRIYIFSRVTHIKTIQNISSFYLILF